MAGHALSAARLLGIVASSTAATAGVSPTENYLRGADLIVAYEKLDQGSIRVDCLWRATEPAADDRFLAAVDLVISVRAQTLDSQPELSVASAMPASDVLRLQGPAGWKPQGLTVGTPAAIVPDGGTGCLLFRLPGADVSYAEMVHPADFQYDELCVMSHAATWRDFPTGCFRRVWKRESSFAAACGASSCGGPMTRRLPPSVMRPLPARNPPLGAWRSSTAALGCAGTARSFATLRMTKVAVHSRGRLCYKGFP